MRTNKARVFIAARKLDIRDTTIRGVMSILGAPPTLAEKPARRIRSRHITWEGQWITLYYRDPADSRDISREFADGLIREMPKFAKRLHDLHADLRMSLE